MDDLDIFIIVALFGDCVGHEEKEIPFHEAEGLPTLFAPFDPILIAQGERVSERPRCGFEADFVLLQVAFGLRDVST